MLSVPQALAKVMAGDVWIISFHKKGFGGHFLPIQTIICPEDQEALFFSP